ncbi:hypothetical protein [Streptomyces sp. NE06-03C]|uniref:hypothetical protein n=1 Tax=Streptomyces sp. NE06-03C TaxID=3028694 RepID=UPI0029B0A337|nr:hypothetical protein [Streptomyces sp. NE06-03C]MDX2922726.1 hypothetical protein [Streptomyces sp. NE06-03C]
MTPEQASARAALLLIRRLIRNHGLTFEEATTAVAQRRLREDGPHTHLVIAEAHAVMTEALAPVRTAIEAMRPMMKAAAAAMAEMTRVLRTALPPQQSDRTGRDRPAWATPYGPPQRRRFR